MWTKWLPWRFVISKAAKVKGFVDPISVLSHLHRLAQPSEVTEPIELLRAGMVLHARGLINTGTIQHNLDWIWPYWVERQFNPNDKSFIPRAFSITHVNLTHRNWTAIGLPDCPHMPIVDPRGLVTPHLDGWSVDAWVIGDDGRRLIPSRCESVQQRWVHNENLVIQTQCEDHDLQLTSRADVVHGNDPICRVRYSAVCTSGGWLVISLRPANPEGVSLLHKVSKLDRTPGWMVDDESEILLSRLPARTAMSNYRGGDVAQQTPDGNNIESLTCDVGMVTAAAIYRIGVSSPGPVTVEVPLTQHTTWPQRLGIRGRPSKNAHRSNGRSTWNETLKDVCQIETPNEQWNELFRTAIASMILHSPDDVFPGPYTYKRFWFRDAAFILNGLLAANSADRVGRVIESFPDRQTRTGYFHSQDGEWDSNGEAIWIIDRYHRCAAMPLSDRMLRSVIAGAKWIVDKRLSDQADSPFAGLMPAGFSAEHLGPNDYYYWDDFWSIAGLETAATVDIDFGKATDAASFQQVARSLRTAIDRTLFATQDRRRIADEIPAAPTRRMDAGAIGSLAGRYPLRVWPADDPRMLGTADFLMQNCFVQGGFFQDMIHSGINPYLTLHLAQVVLRSGCEPRECHIELIQSVADLASPTGQWPEAIHPHTHGGCMGDTDAMSVDPDSGHVTVLLSNPCRDRTVDSAQP